MAALPIITYMYYWPTALAAGRSEVLLEVLLTVEGAVLLHEAHALQGDAALGVGAQEVIRAPRLVQSQHKWTSARKEDMTIELTKNSQNLNLPIKMDSARKENLRIELTKNSQHF